MTVTTNSNQVVISASAKAFVVPNTMNRLGYFMENNEILVNRVTELARSNGIDVSETTRLTELWIHSDELSTDNLSDNGFLAKIDGNDVSLHAYNASIWPAELFIGKKEGDVVNVTIPVKDDITLNLELELDQAGGRYRRFGTFEEVLQKCS